MNVSLDSINWRQLQRELEASLSDRFRRVWINYTRLGSVCITAFPVNPNETYRIFTQTKVQDWSVEGLRNIVLSQIEKP
jgi:hypothetical protein